MSSGSDPAPTPAPAAAPARGWGWSGHGPRLALVAAGLVLAVAGLRAASWLVAPCFLALVIVVLTYPVHRRLRRRGVPAAVALAVYIATGYATIVVLAAVVVTAALQLTRFLRENRPDLDHLLGSVHTTLADVGFAEGQVAAFVDAVTPAHVLRWSATVVPSLIGVGTTVVFFAGLLLFLTVEATQVDVRMAGIRGTRPALGAALDDWASLTRRYFAVTTVFAVLVGTLDTLFLVTVGIPHPVVWGLLAAACNFIPYVGFVIGLVPPALIAVFDGDWGLALLIVVVYIVLNSIATTLVPAKVIGDVVGLAMWATVVSLVFWAWVLGPIGSVLAVPCTLLVKSVLIDADSRAAFLAPVVQSARRNGRPSRVVTDPVPGGTGRRKWSS